VKTTQISNYDFSGYGRRLRKQRHPTRLGVNDSFLCNLSVVVLLYDFTANTQRSHGEI